MTVSLKSCLSMLALGICISQASPLIASKPDNAAWAFATLQQLVGSWARVGETGEDFRIEFTMTANDSVLMETWLRQGHPHSLTVYHRDGRDLLATHYCPQGNQPRLQLQHGDDDNRIEFHFRDATNLTDPNRSHQHSLGFEFNESGLRVERFESYLKSGTEHTSSLRLERMSQ